MCITAGCGKIDIKCYQTINLFQYSDDVPCLVWTSILLETFFTPPNLYHQGKLYNKRMNPFSISNFVSYPSIIHSTNPQTWRSAQGMKLQPCIYQYYIRPFLKDIPTSTSAPSKVIPANVRYIYQALRLGASRPGGSGAISGRRAARRVTGVLVSASIVRV